MSWKKIENFECVYKKKRRKRLRVIKCSQNALENLCLLIPANKTKKEKGKKLQ
jgi:hypothetical protein